MGLVEFISVGLAVAKVAPELFDTLKLWAQTGHEPTEAEIAELETRHGLADAGLRERIAAAKARLNGGPA